LARSHLERKGLKAHPTPNFVLSDTDALNVQLSKLEDNSTSETGEFRMIFLV
jgi:hypothetical protein